MSFLTWSFFLAEVLAAHLFFGSSAKANEFDGVFSNQGSDFEPRGLEAETSGLEYGRLGEPPESESSAASHLAPEPQLVVGQPEIAALSATADDGVSDHLGGSGSHSAGAVQSTGHGVSSTAPDAVEDGNGDTTNGNGLPNAVDPPAVDQDLGEIADTVIDTVIENIPGRILDTLGDLEIVENVVDVATEVVATVDAVLDVLNPQGEEIALQANLGDVLNGDLTVDFGDGPLAALDLWLGELAQLGIDADISDVVSADFDAGISELTSINLDVEADEGIAIELDTGLQGLVDAGIALEVSSDEEIGMALDVGLGLPASVAQISETLNAATPLVVGDGSPFSGGPAPAAPQGVEFLMVDSEEVIDSGLGTVGGHLDFVSSDKPSQTQPIELFSSGQYTDYGIEFNSGGQLTVGHAGEPNGGNVTVHETSESEPSNSENGLDELTQVTALVSSLDNVTGSGAISGLL